ncbi:histidine phosphatase family protein [Candidatus Woesearchaeota archaeon]|nr:histidine phosphatase family protein [Candidatus Woesearchaeota archaeon]
MKLKIYLFRHAQTYFNKHHYFTGHKDSKLTSLGLKQAKKIAVKLKGKRIDVAYQTKLSRSKDTLKEVLKYHSECKKIITDNRMIERSYGVLEGHSHESFIKEHGHEDYEVLLHEHKVHHLHGKAREEFERAVGKAELQVIRRNYEAWPPGGESVEMVERRVLPFIKDLLKYMKVNKVNVAISAHGNSMRPFRRYFEDFSVEEMMSLENPWDDYFEYEIEV